jgi:hypothetical protein
VWLAGKEARVAGKDSNTRAKLWRDTGAYLVARPDKAQCPECQKVVEGHLLVRGHYPEPLYRLQMKALSAVPGLTRHGIIRWIREYLRATYPSAPMKGWRWECRDCNNRKSHTEKRAKALALAHA